MLGGEARFTGGALGNGYIGYSHIDARNINALADSIELVHSYGGYQFKQNFFGKTYNRHTGVYLGPQNETGTVDNILFQYSFSFGALARYPEDFWGDGPDLTVTVYGLLSIVDSPPPQSALRHPPASMLVGRRGERLEHPDQEAEDGASTRSTRRSTGSGSTGASTGCSRTSTPPTPKAGNPGGSDLSFATVIGPPAVPHPVRHARDRAAAVLALLPGQAARTRRTRTTGSRESDADVVGLFASMWW